MTEAYGWEGRIVVDAAGKMIGRIERIFEDQKTGQPDWALVRSGFFRRLHLVPLIDATPKRENVQVTVSKDLVDSAPVINSRGEVSEDVQRRLAAHYSLSPMLGAITHGRSPSDAEQHGRQGAPVVKPDHRDGEATMS